MLGQRLQMVVRIIEEDMFVWSITLRDECDWSLHDQTGPCQVANY